MSTSKRDLRTSGDLVMAPRVPHGLAAAVEGLTREVIRHRPEDIYVFAAQHFEELLKLRDEYGAVTNLPGKSNNTAALREMNQSLKKRSGTEKGSRSNKDRAGWSMNETARVLERHRSIFGDKGKKVSPEEIRALGNEKENKSRRREDLEKLANTTNQKRRGSNERFVRRKIPPKEPDPPENKSKSDSNGNPKIISQIPTLTQSTGLLAKDIKSELRKNRNSSRDGRGIREIAARQSGATRKTLIRSSHERSLDKLIDAENEAEDIYSARIRTDNQKLKTDASGRSRSFAKMPRTLSMDRVREYVVEKFRGSESWEELRSTNYVDRVQEVIDEASPSIMRRVKELTTRSAGRSRGYESVDESTSTSTRSDKSNQTDDVRSRSAMSASRRSRRSTRRTKSKSKSKTSGADSLEGIETLASETEQPKEGRNEIDVEKLKKSISKTAVNGLSGESDASDYTDLIRKASASSGISLPAVRPLSSKTPSRSVSRSDSDNLVLPPIPPEASRSAKQREELVLPSLQIPKEVIRGIENSLEENSLHDNEEVELNLPDAPTNEIFKDSLNVTPEIAVSPRPDSLEPDENGDNIAELKSQLNEINSVPDDRGMEEADGNSGIKERLTEIEETEKRIEKIFRAESQESCGDNINAFSVKEKLIEIQEAEKRLSDILDPGANVKENQDSKAEEIQKDLNEPGMKEKLIEIEETEKRIEKILDSEAQEIQEDGHDHGMKEKLMEIEETEKRIEKIFQFEVQKTEVDDGMKEKLIEIEEAEKRIEKILDSEAQEIQEHGHDHGMKEKLMEIEETEKRIEKIFQSEVQKEEVDDGMKEKLIEIEETEKRIEKILDSEAQEIQEDSDDHGIREKLMEIEETEKRIEKIFQSEVQKEEVDDGMKEKLIEIEETEKRIEKILDSEAQEIQEDSDDHGIKEKLMEIEETEKRIEKIFQSEIQKDEVDDELKEELVEIEETEKRMEKILDSEAQEIQKDGHDHGIKEKLMEIEETEERMKQIFQPETQEIQKYKDDDGMKEKLVEIEETEKRIEKILYPEAQEVQRDLYDSEIKAKLIEIEETEKRIEEIFHSEVPQDQTEKTEAGSVKDKLQAIEEAEKRLKTILDSTSGNEQSHNSAPRTPFIPEIPSEYVTAVNQAENIEEGDEHELAEIELTQKESAEHNETKAQETESKVEQFSSGTPDSLGNSYVLTEGSPYEIPDSVTTVIIPERPTDTPSSDILEIVLEDDLVAKECEESPEEESREISLRNILDNFGEVVHQEPVVPPSSMDVDFIKNLKTSNDVIIPRKDLGLIAEEDDKDFAEAVAKELASPILHDIAESEEALDIEEPGNASTGSLHSPGDEDEVIEIEGDSEVAEIGSPQALDSKEEGEEEDRVSEDRKTRSLETIEAEIASPITLQQNVTDSATTESTDEVKETTISDDGGNTAAESSVTSPSCGEEIGARNSESSNEVKETTISDRPADEIAKNLFSLVPQCHGTMPHVPELNLDSLQDITVSSFQLSDDATAEEDSDPGQPQSEKSASTATEDGREFQGHQPVHEDVIVEEKVLVEEDPCTKVTAYVEGPKPEDSDHKVTEFLASQIEETGLSEPEERVEEVLAKETEELEEVTKDLAGKVAEKDHNYTHDEIVENVKDRIPEEDPEEVAKEPDAKVLEEKLEDAAEDEAEKVSETKEVAEDLTEKVVEEEPKEVAKLAAEKVAEEEEEAGREVENRVEKEDEEVVEIAVDKDSEDSAKKGTQAEDLVSKSEISGLETVSLNDFKALEASIGEEDVEVEKNSEFNQTEIGNTEVDGILIVPEVVGSTEPENDANDSSSSSPKIEDPVSAAGHLDPPKAQVVTNDLDDDPGAENNGEKLEYHIYVPEVTASEEFSTTESSTFNSAATKIQAGVRGFLTRRRLQSAQRRSSTLDSVPSIQDSVAADVSHLEPIEEVGLSQAATTIQSSYRGYKARQRLRREDAVQKTTMSVENPFSGIGLQHTGEFHDCLPLPPLQYDENKPAPVCPAGTSLQSDPDLEDSVAAVYSEEKEGGPDADGSQENRELMTTESTTTKEESAGDESTFDLLLAKYPNAPHQGLSLVVLSGNDAVLQSQYLNFITSIEEVNNENDSLLIPGENPLKIIDAFSTLKSNAGIESLPLDNTEADVSVQDISAREPLAVPGSPTGLIIEELSKTEEESIPVDLTSTSSITNCVKNEENDVVSDVQDDSLDLPGLSLEGKTTNVSHVTVPSAGKEKSPDTVEETHVSLAPDASLGTMSFSMNVDDMLGLGAESDHRADSKMKPILEVTVTPRDLLKLTNRSQGSQASGDRVESPVTMMQIVPKSVEDKSDRSEDDRETDTKKSEEAAKPGDGTNQPIEEISAKNSGVDISSSNVQEVKEVPKASSNEDDEESDGMSKTFSMEKN